MIVSSKRRRFTAEPLEFRLCLTEISFTPIDIDVTETVSPTAVRIGDLDGDGDGDLISASFRDGKIAWYPRTEPERDFGQQNVIMRRESGVSWLEVADIDGDSDLDLIFGSTDDIAWIENLDGRANFGEERVIGTTTSRFRTPDIVDIDGDGDLDVLTTTPEDEIVWFENTDSKGDYSDPQSIVATAGDVLVVSAADIDGDDDLDVIAFISVPGNHRITWYENLNGSETFRDKGSVFTRWWNISSLSTGDIDSDGDLDLLVNYFDFFRDRKIGWFENINGAGRFSAENRITDSFASSASLSDVDADGDLDIIASVASVTSWLENTNGKGDFQKQHLIPDASTPYDSRDVDGDGDLDLVTMSSSDDKIAWHENTNGKGEFGDEQIITLGAHATRSLVDGDVDGDGDNDFVSVSTTEKSIVWFEKINDNGTFERREVASLETDRYSGTSTLFVDDLDGDSDLDILLAYYSSRVGFDDAFVVWFENKDGKGNFGEPQPIETIDGLKSAAAGDIDGDGDADVLVTEIFSSKIAWYENVNGTGDFSKTNVITTDAKFVQSASFADIDGDGDLDILSRAWFRVAWYENTDGRGNFGVQREIVASLDRFTFLSVGDIDGDGDLDVVSASYRATTIDRKVLWFENKGDGTFSEPHLIATNFSRPKLADLDNDGDLDAVATANDGFVAWFENSDGQGQFGQPQVMLQLEGSVRAIALDDIDQDGDIDAIVGSSSTDSGANIRWYQNDLIKERVIGDANGDGIFNSSDLVAVFQASEYEDGIDGNSTFEEGDWNGDGDFDSSDLVAAFQAGTYTVDARLADLLAAMLDDVGRNDKDFRPSRK